MFGTVEVDETYVGYKSSSQALGIKEEPQKRIYIVRSNQINPKYKIVQPKLMAIAGNALSKLTSSQGVGDLYRIYMITQRDGIEFNLASIPDEFVANPKEPFDPEEMNRLYYLAYKMAKSGYPWEKFPTGYHD